MSINSQIPAQIPAKGIDIDKLKALALAATPGEWISKPHGRIVGGPLRHYVNGSAQSQIAAFSVTFHDQAPEDEPERQQDNAAFCAAANPAAVLELIAEVERLGLELQNQRELVQHWKASAGYISAAPAAGTEKDADPTEASVNIIRGAIADYYRALNNRQHGELAMDRSFRAIERELGMTWDMWTRAENEAIGAHSKAGEPLKTKPKEHDD